MGKGKIVMAEKPEPPVDGGLPGGLVLLGLVVVFAFALICLFGKSS